MRRYQTNERTTLGQGSYGTVFKTRDDQTKKDVAVKRARLDHDDEILSTYLREISLLKQLGQHDNIIRMLDNVQEKGRLYIVFELGECNLAEYFRQHNYILRPAFIKTCMLQIFDGVAFCHAQRVVHRDLKPANIIVFPPDRIKIADFGLARLVLVDTIPKTNEVVTLWYRPLEIFFGSTQYGYEVDVWSCGVIMLELLTGAIPFVGNRTTKLETDIAMMCAIMNALGVPTEETWPGVSDLINWRPTFQIDSPPRGLWNMTSTPHNDRAKNLVDQILVLNPKRRLTAQGARMHQYFY
jgi:serine/threonine protein kinase